MVRLSAIDESPGSKTPDGFIHASCIFVGRVHSAMIGRRASLGEFREGLTMSTILSGIELEGIVAKLMVAEAEILHLAIEEENVSEAPSDLWGVFEMLQEIILKIQSLL